MRNDLGAELVEYAMLFGAVLMLAVGMSAFTSGCGKAMQHNQRSEYACWTPNEPGIRDTCRKD